MADTGWKNPTATGLVYNDYTNPTNAYASDNNYATRLMADGSTFRQSYSSFDFGIPVGATINGIEISIEGHATVQIALAYYVYNKSGDSNKRTVTTPSYHTATNDNTIVAGGSDSLFGADWIVSDFSDANFYMYCTTDPNGTDGITLSLDHIKIKVYYTEAADVKINIADVFKNVDSMKVNIGDAWKDVAGIKINIGDVWKDVF